MADDYGTGYNPGKIKELGKEVVAAAVSSCQSIEKHIENDVVTPMSTAWYTHEGKAYFTKLQINMSTIGKSIRDDIFKAFVSNLEAAGDAWKKATGNSDADVTIDTTGIENAKIDIDIKSIKEVDPNGFIGIKDEDFKTVIGNLATSEQQLKTEIDNLKSTLHSSDAFVGQGQGAAVDSFFNKIVVEIGKLYGSITKDLNTTFDAHQTQNTKDATSNTNAWSTSNVSISLN